MGRPNGASDALEQSSPVQSSNPPSPKGRNLRTSTSSGPPTTFFLKSEDEVDNMNSSTMTTTQDSTYGVQSLQSNISATDDVEPATTTDGAVSNPNTERSSKLEEEYEEETSEEAEVEPLHRQRSVDFSANNSPARALPYTRSAPRLAFPLAPLQLYSPSPGTESAPLSTPRSASLRSLRLSDEDSGLDDTGSQAIASSSDEEDNNPLLPPEGETEAAPQLVMPSIRMPSRRPFTDKGKAMGKLKVMVLGPQGIGKTSLIRSIVQTCEDIVHVDPLESSLPNVELLDPNRSSQQAHGFSRATRQVTEISASTRAYPTWWSDLEDSKILRRKRSTGETVLERNVSFLDTPGYPRTESASGTLYSSLQHIEKLLHRSTSLASLSDNEILSILSGNGGIQVDLVLFVFEKHPASHELELFKSLSLLTNVVPVIGKADLLSDEELQSLRSAFIHQMKAIDVAPFLFGTSISDLTEPHSASVPFAISSATSNDDDNMDASLLMSPDYIQPLIPSDLSALVSQIFNPDTTAWLRHLSAKKFLQWHKASLAATRPPSMSLNTLRPPTTFDAFATPTPTPGLNQSATTSSASSSVFCPPSPVIVSHPFHPTTSHALARVADHTQREERLAQVHLARWATDLQRAISNERSRFAQLQHEQRQSWLEDRLEECHSERGGEEKDSLRTATSRGSHTIRDYRRSSVLDPTDPLGVLDWDERVRRRLALVLKVVGGCGVVGAVTVWLLKAWSWWAPASFSGSDGLMTYDNALGAVGAGAGAGAGAGTVVAAGWLGSLVFVG